MPEISRRSLFAMMAGAFTLDPERLLWTPGKKLISIPKPRLNPLYEMLSGAELILCDHLGRTLCRIPLDRDSFKDLASRVIVNKRPLEGTVERTGTVDFSLLCLSDGNDGKAVSSDVQLSSNCLVTGTRVVLTDYKVTECGYA